VPLSAPRFGLAWRASQPRPDSTATVTPFADFTELLAFQAHGARHWGPRGRPSIPMAWASTRGKRQERAARLVDGPDEAALRGSGEESRLATITKNGMPGRPLRLDGPALPGRPALPGCTRRGPGPRPGPRGAASLWGLYPSRPVILDPCPLAPEGPGLWVVP
jgi:hypothetical protein